MGPINGAIKASASNRSLVRLQFAFESSYMGPRVQVSTLPETDPEFNIRTEKYEHRANLPVPDAADFCDLHEK